MKKLKQNKGITLIALIITIIVMLLLVGVTISVALNGGIFSKGEKAGYQTNASTIKEQLALKKAEIIAEANGKQPETYTISLSHLAIPEKMKEEFETKLIISSDAELYYDSSVVTEKEEQDWLKEIGITEYIEEPIPPPTLELVQIAKGVYSDHASIGIIIKFGNFDQAYSTTEEYYYNFIKKAEDPDNLGDYLLQVYNSELDTDYGTIEETGMTVEEMFELIVCGGESWENCGSHIAFMDESRSYSIKRPDGTTGVFEFGGDYSSFNELEGIYQYGRIETEDGGYYYSATQTGIYEISTTIAGYTITDTITIEEF